MCSLRLWPVRLRGEIGLKRKGFSIILGASVILTYLTGCTGETRYQFSQPLDSICSIEVVDISGDDVRTNQELGKVTVIQPLFSSDWEPFLNSLQDIPCWKYWNDPPQDIRNKAIQIRYEDGTIEILSSSSSGLCAELNGVYTVLDYNCFYFDEEMFLGLLNIYSERNCESPKNCVPPCF